MTRRMLDSQGFRAARRVQSSGEGIKQPADTELTGWRRGNRNVPDVPHMQGGCKRSSIWWNDVEANGPAYSARHQLTARTGQPNIIKCLRQYTSAESD